MKILVLALAAAGLLAGSATASERMSDVVFLKAVRCDGLSKSLPGVIDDKAMDALYKGASAGRQPPVMDRADQAFADGKREGRTSKEKSTAELTGACTALLTNPASVAVR